ncbi:hypothetical protein T265_13567, partial [Opisthorchis viverrini]
MHGAGILPGCPGLDRGSREAGGRARTTDLSVTRRTDQQPPDHLPTNAPDLPIYQHITNFHQLQLFIRTRLSKTSGLGNLAVTQPSCFLWVTWQLGTERMLQLNDYLWNRSFFVKTEDQPPPRVTPSYLLYSFTSLYNSVSLMQDPDGLDNPRP